MKRSERLLIAIFFTILTIPFLIHSQGYGAGPIYVGPIGCKGSWQEEGGHHLY